MCGWVVSSSKCSSSISSALWTRCCRIFWYTHSPPYAVLPSGTPVHNTEQGGFWVLLIWYGTASGLLIKGLPILTHLSDGGAPVVDWAHPSSDDLQKESIKPVGDQKTSPLNSTTDISSNPVSFKDTAILGLCHLYWRTCLYLLLEIQ